MVALSRPFIVRWFANVLDDDLNYLITGYRTMRVLDSMPEQELHELSQAFREELQRRHEAEIQAIERGE